MARSEPHTFLFSQVCQKPRCGLNKQQQPQAAQANPPQQQPPVMGLADMPARRERSVPYFDDSRPEELNRYFADLQFLLNRFQVVDQNERKQAAVKYLKI